MTFGTAETFRRPFRRVLFVRHPVICLEGNEERCARFHIQSGFVCPKSAQNIAIETISYDGVRKKTQRSRFAVSNLLILLNRVWTKTVFMKTSTMG